MNGECSVPWECTVCGRRGTVEVPAGVIGCGAARMAHLFEATMEQHGLKQRCGLVHIFWEWPEAWAAEPGWDLLEAPQL